MESGRLPTMLRCTRFAPANAAERTHTCARFAAKGAILFEEGRARSIKSGGRSACPGRPRHARRTISPPSTSGALSTRPRCSLKADLLRWGVRHARRRHPRRRPHPVHRNAEARNGRSVVAGWMTTSPSRPCSAKRTGGRAPPANPTTRRSSWFPPRAAGHRRRHGGADPQDH